MPKNLLTPFTIGSTIVVFSQLPILRIAPAMPLSRPETIWPPIVFHPVTTCAPQEMIWLGSRLNQPDSADQARPSAPLTVETTLPHQVATVRCTEPATPVMKLRIVVNTRSTTPQIALTVVVMKLRIWVQ